MIRGKIFPYYWHHSIDNEGTEDESTLIRMYGLDNENKSVCVIIKNFTPYIYLELPNNIEWNDVRAQMLGNKIDEIMGNYKPVKKSLQFKKKLYFANKNKSKIFPFMLVAFATRKDIMKLCYRINKPITVSGLGSISLKMHEQSANPILQLVSVREIPTTGWIFYKGRKITGDDKETECNLEIRVKYKNLSKIDSDEIPKPLVLGMDIEVNSTNPNRMPDSSIPGDKIFQISCVLTNSKNEHNKFLLTLGNPDKNILTDITVLTFKTEADLLVGYAEFVQKYNPNVITGYNIFKFDIPYMIERAEYNYVLDSFSKQGFDKYGKAPKKKIKWTSAAYKNQEFEFLDAQGRLHIDLLPLVKRDYKFDNYTLKTISQFFIGETKDPLGYKDIFRCYRIGMKGGEKGNKAMAIVGKYCVQDSLLVNKLLSTLETWVGLCEMAKTCNVPIFSLYTQGQQIKVYSQVYKYCMYHNYVVESDGYIANENEKYSGAVVFDPIPGLYEKIIPFDFASLYPTVIIAYNIDYSTFVRDKSIPDHMCHIFDWEDHKGCEHDKTKRKVKVPKDKILCAHHRYRFLKEPKGIIPTVLEDLLDARRNTRSEMKQIKEKIKQTDVESEIKSLEKLLVVLDKRQLSYKVSCNSMYGAMGVKKGYLPFLPGAMCTTAGGRKSIEKAVDYIQKNYAGNLIYGDTDSCYINFPKLKTAEECWDFSLKVEKEIESLFPKPMKLEFEEKIYWRFFILTKKRYMALFCERDGKISDNMFKRGVLLVRRDNSIAIREVYQNIIMMVFNKASEASVLDFLIDKINELCYGKVDNTKFIITKSIGDVNDYKIRPLPEDEKKRLKRLKDLGINPEWEELPPSKENQDKYNNKLQEIYCEKSLPAHAQLGERLKRRGKIVDAGSRLEFIVTTNGGIKANQFEKIEDPKYQQEHSDIIKIDYLYYLHLLINPIDEVLEVGYKIKDFVKNQHKLRIKKYEMCREIETLFNPKQIFEE